jgi:ATP-binding cassette, subfamily C (CFTR/MRP), member 1
LTPKIAIGAYIGLQLALVVLSAQHKTRNQVSVAASSLSLLTGLSLALLSHLEHAKAIRPSFLINLYLLATLLFDAARVRTEWLIGTDDGYAGALTASLSVKCVMLVLEAVEKRSLLLGMERHFSVESTSGIFSRIVFWWLNPLMLSGSKTTLTVDGLPVVHEKLDSADLARDVQPAWEKCKPLILLLPCKPLTHRS